MYAAIDRSHLAMSIIKHLRSPYKWNPNSNNHYSGRTPNLWDARYNNTYKHTYSTKRVRLLYIRRVAMIQMDVQKVFDRLKHDALFSILSYIGFGVVIKEVVNITYINCSTKLGANEKISSSIPVLPSVRQGCPMSPLIFALYVVPYSMPIERTPPPLGEFHLHSVKVKTLTYADDIAVFCRDLERVSLII